MAQPDPQPQPRAAEPLADDASARIDAPSARGPARPRLQAACTALALVFFLGPLALIAAGQHGEPLPAEHPARAPGVSQGWGFFDAATPYLTQQLPYRNRAVTAYNWIFRHVFGTTPSYGAATAGGGALPFGGLPGSNSGGYAQTGGATAGHPLVAVGRDGWLFLQGELDTLCAPPVAFGTAIARWVRFVQEIRASGRRVVLLIVPEKSTIYPEYVTPGTLNWTCAEDAKARLWSAIESVHQPGFVPLRQRLLAEKRQDPARLLYLPFDSHWNFFGGLLLVQTALQTLGGPVQVAPGEGHVVGNRYYTGDLSTLLGSPRQALTPSVVITRAGDDRVTTVSSGPSGAVTTHPGGPQTVIPGPTLFLHDSYGDAPLAMLQHYAARLTDASWMSLTPSRIAQLIQGSRTVIIETVERYFLDRSAIGIQPSVLTPGFLASLPEVLARPPGR